MKLGITWGQKLGLPECPYMKRWVLNLHFFSIRIHHWYASDDHRAWHDHPWWFFTFVLSGGYTDISDKGKEQMRQGSWSYRPALHKHTVSVNPGGCWTIILTGKQSRKWGFWVGKKFFKANKYFFEYGHHPCD